jgi:hypothetical protein
MAGQLEGHMRQRRRCQSAVFRDPSERYDPSVTAAATS